MSKNRLIRLLFFFAFSCYIVPLRAQVAVKSADSLFACTGTIKDITGMPLAGTTLELKGTAIKTMSDQDGHFTLKNLSSRRYQLLITHLGHKTQSVSLDFLKQRQISLDIILETNSGELQEVNIIGKTENRLLAERPVLTQVVNTKSVQEQPTTLVELLTRTAGIRVRQTGGLGSQSNLMINGFQNRSIRYFKDGIPMDYLGSGFDISLVPVNMLERVEVYKGVLPPALGADALGGALNLVTKQHTDQHLDFSYETGSFNTHRASANVFYKNKEKHYFVGASAFYNYSDNDYKVNVQVVNPNTGNLYDVTTPLFHSRFKNYYWEVYGGITNTKWADELRIGLTAFDIDRQINYGASMSQAIGAATNHQDAVIPTLRYRKAFWDGRLHADQFLTANTLHSNQVDTAKGQYNWLGEFIPSDSRLGELSARGSLAKLDFSYYTSRTHLGLALDARHQLDFNAVISGFSRKGSDPFGPRFVSTGEDVLNKTSAYSKQIFGLGLTSELIDKKLSNQLLARYYHYGTDATDADFEGNAQYNKNSNNSWGVAEALKLNLSDYTYLRLSGETALRLPEQDELFGDGDRKLSNFNLKPERSLNLNLGFRTSIHSKHTLEINTFYRVTHDMILQLPYNFLYSQSQNIDNVRGIGFEADGEVTLLPWLKATGNFTYQDQRIYNTGNPSLEHSRLRNTPFFFANAALYGSFKKLLHPADKLDVYWNYLFVREYYLDALPKDKEPDGFLGLWGKAGLDARNIIPDQSIQSFGFTYTPAFQSVIIGFQVKNIFDSTVYDNFRIQNPGRSFFLKLNYILK